ncbi:hypothetical protein K6Q96_00685 [Grimontia kaedaensis]|uniref:Nucleotide-diphospho-sugar transferase domain-containing protein n=1 Tax=Grimontia kaedaensis TaxID=2872157 RepID=A0ABY4WSU3_9GAMM|nr:hypothetical protein [Grimontia kaedaensis]USH02598.1 hypothetical protein K6Q96_00685 [Grimontia kaedaensis]
MILTLLTFGDRLENHYQASFAILSFLKTPLIEKICVVTDRPQYYNYFGSYVDIIEINKEIMDEWRGEHDFFWRIKMKGVEAAILKNPNQNIMYIDSDTFYVHNLEQIVTGLNNGYSYMHEKEGTLSNSSSSTFLKMWKSLKGKTFSGITITDQSEMWNAGVIAISAQKARDTISLAISICDEICATNCTRRLVEQFAFSIALKSVGNLSSAETQIGHYWGNKEQWNAKITDFFMHSLLTDSNLENDIIRIKELQLDNLPTVYKEKSIKRKVHNLLDKLLPPKEVRHFCKQGAKRD